MMKSKTISFQTSGTSTRTRMRLALDPKSFGIDERKISDLMAFILKFSEKVRYINEKDEPDGNWSPFFENNLAFVIALISTTDVNAFDSRFKEAVQHIDDEIIGEEKQQTLKKLLQYTFELFEVVDRWYKLSRHDLVHIEENKLAEHLKNAIGLKLGPQLSVFKLLLQSVNQRFFSGNEIEFDFEALDYSWNQHRKLQLPSPEEQETLALKKAIKDTSLIHKAVFGVIAYLQSIAPELLDHAITHYPYHSPHISLFISFLKSFAHIQHDTNLLTQRHLDYYYNTVLKQKLRPSEPDQVHVYFQPSEHIGKASIPAGTLLAAGTDEEGLEYTYATDYDLEINRSRISDLKVIHVAQNPLIGVSNTFKSVSNIYARSVLIDQQGRALDNNNYPAPFDTFGKDQADINYANRDMQQAKIGFAIASPILLLKEGERNISIQYKFNLKSLSSLISFIEDITQREKLSPENAFYKLLNNIFKIRITTETGWFEVDRYEILPPKSWTTGEVHIDMNLDVADPAMISYNEELHGSGFSTSWPILEFTLSSRHAMYAYSYLRDLTIEECTIDVTVNKAKDLQVFNDLGKLDINKPFYPFGSVPDIGSYFLVGNEEMFRKNLTRFALDIHWHNVPRAKGGFATYYKDYKSDITTDSFKVGITALSDFRFHPVDEKDVQQISIFNENKAGVVDELLHVSSINLEELQLKPNYREMDLSEYSGRTRSGFLKFEMMEPETGFGFSEYPKLFAGAVLENSKTKKTDLPNEPYAPLIRSMSISYAATTVLTMNVNKVAENDKMSNDQIYHLHPFGNMVVFEDGLPVNNHIVPQFDDEGYLIIGLENVHAPLELSFYFELEDNVTNEINHANIPATKWRYLAGNEWVDFEENELIFDTTNNFTTSGIIRLKVPANIDTAHTILPADKCWISVSSASNTQILSKTLWVQTNAVSATWKAHKPGEQWKTNIAANTISGLILTRSDVNGVFQPFPGFGGRKVETPGHYYTRTSERLKHKNRAITPDDYEKIILDRFPFLFQVKCINHFSHPDFVRKGHIKLIVVPKLVQTTSFYEPNLDYNQLDRIQEYLQNRISPYANIEVFNPVYEKVRISCKVVLNSNTNSGEFVKQLETDLRKFICPWFGEHQQEMNFGGSIERDDTLSFIESLSYVKFVTRLSVVVMHYNDGKYSLSDSASNDGKTNELRSSTPWSVLIPAGHHEIELMNKPDYEAAQETRIETMKIGTDFVISEEKEADVEFPYFDLDKDTYYAIEIDL